MMLHVIRQGLAFERQVVCFSLEGEIRAILQTWFVSFCQPKGGRKPFSRRGVGYGETAVTLSSRSWQHRMGQTWFGHGLWGMAVGQK